eukprot:tig00001669_g9562.t1
MVSYAPLFPGFGWRHALASLGVFTGSAMASGGGIGGGGLYVPLFIFALGFTTREAIPLSKATIFGVSLGNMIQLFRKRHPHADRPIIDFDMALVLEPTTLSGVMVGVLLNVTLPTWLIDILIVLMVVYTVWTTVRKGLKQYLMDRAAQRRASIILALQSDAAWLADESIRSPDVSTREVSVKVGEPPSPSPATAAPGGGGLPLAPFVQSPSTQLYGPAVAMKLAGGAGTPAPPSEAANGPAKGGPAANGQGNGQANGAQRREEAGRALETNAELASVEVARILLKERVFQFRKFFALLACSAVYLTCTLMLGGRGAHSVVGIKGCTAVWWSLIWVPFFGFYVVAYIYGRWVKAEYDRKVWFGFPFKPFDVRWTERGIRVYPLYSVGAGMVAGALGLGGGVVKGPLMLDLGLHPQVVMATSSYMILFTSVSSTTAFSVFGMLRWDYAIWFCSCGLAGALVSHWVVDRLLKRYRGYVQSIEIFILSAVIAVSAILLVITTTVTVVEDFKLRRHLGFNTDYCQA